MLRITAVGRVTRLETRDKDVYLYVECSFWNTETANRDSSTIVFRVPANKFTAGLMGRSVYVEGTDLRIVPASSGDQSLVIVMQSRIESA